MTEAAATPKPKRGTFYRIRVTILSLILGGVILYAWFDVHRRHSRTTWKRPINIAYVVVCEAPVEPGSLKALEERVPALEQRLDDEMKRYKPDGPSPPFRVTVLGPVVGAEPPPQPPPEGGIVANTLYQFHLNRWTAKVDAIGNLDTHFFDSRIYLFARPPESAQRKEIEGSSELGGTVGVVRVELDASMADFTLFVASHEMFHTLGATDKYAPDGSILVPDGLAEPDLQPIYPQRYAELMARHRPISAIVNRPPVNLDQLAVGAKTAEEIGWLPKAP